MSNIEVIQDTGLARLLWEGTVQHLKQEHVSSSVESLIWAFYENGTEPDYRRAEHRAFRTIKHMVSAQEAVWVTDSKGRNTHYRCLTFKERAAVQALKVKNASVKLPEDAFKK